MTIPGLCKGLKKGGKLGRERDVERAYSVNGVPIRLTYERWFHITENHDDLASYYFEVLEAVEKPGIHNQGQ